MKLGVVQRAGYTQVLSPVPSIAQYIELYHSETEDL